MSQYVYVVTNSELGWDNVVGVFDPDTVDSDELHARFSGRYYHIDQQRVETNLDAYD